MNLSMYAYPANWAFKSVVSSENKLLIIDYSVSYLLIYAEMRIKFTTGYTFMASVTKIIWKHSFRLNFGSEVVGTFFFFFVKK